MKKNVIFFVCAILFVVAAMHASDETASEKLSAKSAGKNAKSNPRREADAALGAYMLEAGKELIRSRDAFICRDLRKERGSCIDFSGSKNDPIISFESRLSRMSWLSGCTISLAPGDNDSDLKKHISNFQQALLLKPYTRGECLLVDSVNTRQFTTTVEVMISFDKAYIPGWFESIHDGLPSHEGEFINLVVPHETRAKMVATFDAFAKKVQDSYKEQDDEKGD